MQEMKEKLEALVSQVEVQYRRIQPFKFPSVVELNPVELTKALVGCSTTYEEIRELSSELKLFIYQVNSLKKSAPSQMYVDMADAAKETLVAYGQALEERASVITSHLTILRGLFSASNKSKTSLGQALVERE